MCNYVNDDNNQQQQPKKKKWHTNRKIISVNPSPPFD